jgi:hypothetical protein
MSIGQKIIHYHKCIAFGYPDVLNENHWNEMESMESGKGDDFFKADKNLLDF